MTVTFCGHREVLQATEVGNWLRNVVCELCRQGAKRFLVGGYGAFDRLAASAVREAKAAFPNVTSILVLPYLDKRADLALYDETLYPPLESVPRRLAIVRRNTWMVAAAEVVVAYVLHDWGGAAKTLAYAKKQGKVVVSFSDGKTPRRDC